MGRGSNGNAGSGRPANSTGYKSKYEGMGINTNGMTQGDLNYLSKLKGKSLDVALDVWNMVKDKTGGHESLATIVKAKPYSEDFSKVNDSWANTSVQTMGKTLKSINNMLSTTEGWDITTKEYINKNKKLAVHLKNLMAWKKKYNLK